MSLSNCLGLNVSDNDFRKKKKKKKKNKLKDGKGESDHASGNSNETNVTTPAEKHPEEVKTILNLDNDSHAKDGQHDGKLSNNE